MQRSKFPTVNVNLTPCGCPKYPNGAHYSTACAGLPVQVPCEIPPSIGPWTIELGGQKVRINLTTRGSSWEDSMIDSVDLHPEHGRDFADDNEAGEAMGQARVRWAGVVASICEPGVYQLEELRDLRRQLYPKIAIMARAEREAYAAQAVADSLLDGVYFLPSECHKDPVPRAAWELAQSSVDRQALSMPSALRLAAYVNKVIETMGVLP